MSETLRAYLALAKPRIGLMVAATTLLGYKLAGGRADGRLAWILLGTTLVSAACGSLNQWLERREDALMARTKLRPLPQGRLAPAQALGFGLCTAAAGLWILTAKSSPLAWIIALATLLLYLGVYTPLKKITPHATWAGALAGATPPLLGWAAASGRLSPLAWLMFGMQFLWQIPHFLAIFWIHREDYAQAGFKVVPALEQGRDLTALQIALNSFSLLIASLLPSLCGMVDFRYGLAALILGVAFLGFGLKTSWTMARLDARRLFLASLAYLPLIFGMLMVAVLSACSKPRAPASKGEAFFKGLGCVQCHQIGDQGGTYGPDLTFVGFRKSPEWLSLWIKNPHSWRPNTIMPNFNLNDETRSALVEYLSAQKGQAYDQNGRPWNAPDFASNSVKRGEVLFNKAGCVACHAQKGRGGYPNNNVAGGMIPSLAKVAEGYTKEELYQKINNGVVSTPDDPSQPAPLIRMPPWGQVLKEDEMRAVVDYLFTLNAAAASSKKEEAW